MFTIPTISPRLLVLFIIGSGLACNSGTTLHAVHGTVHFEGQPAEGATVILQPTNGTSEGTPSGIVAADGSFTITTHPHGTGAPAGEYAVLVTWFPPDARQATNPKNKLPAKYSEPTQTPVPKFTVQAGRNDIPPLKLTAK